MRTRFWDLKGGNRIIRGEVASDGSIINGTGFVVISRLANIITIGFTDKFSAPPTVILTQREFQNYVMLSQGSVTASQFASSGYDAAQTVNRFAGFYFVAIGSA